MKFIRRARMAIQVALLILLFHITQHHPAFAQEGQWINTKTFDKIITLEKHDEQKCIQDYLEGGGTPNTGEMNLLISSSKKTTSMQQVKFCDSPPHQQQSFNSITLENVAIRGPDNFFNNIQMKSLLISNSSIYLARFLIESQNNASQIIIKNSNITLASFSPLIQGEYEHIEINNCRIDSIIPATSFIEASSIKLMITGNLFQNIDKSMVLNQKEGRYLEVQKNQFIGCKDIKITIQQTLIINFNDNTFLNLTQTQGELISVTNEVPNISNFTNLNFQDLVSLHHLFEFDSSKSNFNFRSIFILNAVTEQPIIHSTSSSCYFLIKDLNLRHSNSSSLVSVKGFNNQIHIISLTTYFVSSTSSLIKAAGRLNALKLDSCQVYESNFTSSSSSLRFIDGIDDTQVVKSQFYRVRARQMFKNARIEMTKFKEVTCEDSLLKVDARVLITNSNFQDNVSNNRGAILSVKGKESEVIVFNSTFKGNSARMGGVVFLDKNSSAKFYDCSFESNFAFVGGVFFGEQHRSLFMQNYMIINNSAITSSILYSQLSYENSTFNTGHIANNNELIKIISSFDQNQRQEHHKKEKRIGGHPESHAIRMTEGKLYVIKTVFENQPNILWATASSLTLENTVITDAIFEKSTMFTLDLSTTLQLTNVSITNITSLSSHNFGQAVADLVLFSLHSSSLLMGSDGFLYSNSSVPLVRSYDSTFMLYNTQDSFVENITIPWDPQQSVTSLIRIENGFLSLVSTSFTNITFQLFKNFKPSFQQVLPSIIHSEVNSNILLFDSRFERMSNCRYIISLSMTSVTTNTVFFNRREFDPDVQLLDFKFGTSAFYIQDSVLMMMDTKLSNIYSPNKGASVIHYKSLNVPPYNFIHELQMDRIAIVNNTGVGSALVIEDTNTTITWSNFTNNTNSDGDGGAISYLCTQKNLQNCVFQAFDNNFTLNKAPNGKGGAISHNLVNAPPDFQLNKFNLNYAKDYQSFIKYPKIISLISIDKPMMRVSSGRKLEQSLILGIIDNNNKGLPEDSHSIVTIKNDENLIRYSGPTSIIMDKGIAKFNNLAIFGMPGSKSNITIQSNIPQVSSLQILVEFNQCNIGEIIKNNQCLQCPKNFYSFKNNETRCKACLENLYCMGGNITIMKSGFWRNHSMSEIIMPCPSKEACLGGTESKCGIGYTGKYCSQCDLSDPLQPYGHVSTNKCSKCPTLLKSFLLYLFWFLVIFGYCFYSIRQILKTQSRISPSTILIRIMINYIQSLRIILQFDFDLPQQVQSILEFLSLKNLELDSALSFDCVLIQMGHSDQSFLKHYHIQTIIYGILPFALSLMSFFVLILVQKVIIKTIDKDWRLNTFQIIIALFFTLINLCYQTILNLSFRMFNCAEMEDGKQYLNEDLNSECWNWDTHLNRALPIAAFFIGIINLGIPLVVFVNLCRNRHNLDKYKVFKAYGVFLIGFKNEYFYWEIVVQNMRRLILICAMTFLPDQYQYFKGLIIIVLLYIQTQMLRISSPYIDPSINRVDFHSQYSANTMIFLCLFTKNQQIEKIYHSISDLVTIFQYAIMLYNLFSFSLWFYYFISAVLRINLKTLRTFTLTQRILKSIKAHNMLTYNQYLKQEIGQELFSKYVREDDTDNLKDSLDNSVMSGNSGRPKIMEYSSSRIIDSSRPDGESPAAQSSRRALYSANESNDLTQVRIINRMKRAIKNRIYQASNSDSIAFGESERS